MANNPDGPGRPHLALVGLMGVGKSEVGAVVAQRLNLRHLDLDVMVTAREGRSVGVLFEEQGESGFRECEQAALADVLSLPQPIVLSTGGGVLERETNKALLAERATVVWLRARLETLAGQLERWLTEPRPALIHGDLWGGNVLAASGRISGFIDPAIYYADAEIELAFSTLFNTFGKAFFSHYNELRPLAPGFFEERRDLYNLYPLLVHVRLFGGGYVGSVERTLKRFGV